MIASSRATLLIATTILIVPFVLLVLQWLPLPDAILLEWRFRPYGSRSLAYAALVNGVVLVVLGLPWAWIMAQRLRARGRRVWWAIIPIALASLNVLGLSIGAAAFAGPEFGYQSENPVPYMEWMRQDGPMLMNLLTGGTLAQGLAGLSTLALVADGLRPDPVPVSDVFT